MIDEWNGLAVLLADMIEKYAGELELDALPDPMFPEEKAAKHNTTKNVLEQIFCENWQNPVKQRITPHFLTTSPSNYYEFTTKE